MTSSTAASSRRSVRRPTMRTSSIRRDIQGLRAIAVLVVVFNHALRWPAGGFVGVDMFFVISGFLITGLLLREFDETGHISFVNFYQRRSKRIVPAATVTLLVVAGLAFMVFTRQRAISAAWDGLFALLFAANWNFALNGTNYFQEGGAVSPVQHYWSLSVEEQFYLVWPWLLLGLLLLFSRRRSGLAPNTRKIAGAAIGIIAIASFWLAAHQSIEAPNFAYFSSFTRVWELGIGALLAAISPILADQPAWVRTATAYLGLLGIAASCLIIDGSTTWPAPWALLPTIATALALASGIGNEARHVTFLTNPVSVYIGDISYSLYLWHFPAIVFVAALFPNGGIKTQAGAIALGFGLAITTYHIVERPLWKSPLWLSTGSTKTAWQEWRLAYARQMRLGGIGILALALTLTAAVSISRTRPADVAVAPANAEPASTGSPGPGSVKSVLDGGGSAAAVVEAEVARSLSDDVWPTQLNPPIDEIGPESKAAQWVRDGCLGLERGSNPDPIANAARCHYGSPTAKRTLVVWGDSVAISWVPGLVQALASRGWRILVLTEAMCPTAMVTVTTADGGTDLPHCDEFRDWAIHRIKDLRPTFVLISQSDFGVTHPASRSIGERARTEFIGGMATSLDAIKGSAHRIAIVSEPSPTVSMGECYTLGGHPSDCTREPLPSHGEMIQDLANMVNARNDPAVSLVNPDPLLCAHDQCPGVVAGYIVRADNRHLTDSYSRYIGPALVELLGISA